MNKSPRSNKGPNPNGGNRTKFPFILMPVSASSGENRNTTNECDLILPSLHLDPPPPPTAQDSLSKAARRNAVVQRELQSRYSRHSSHNHPDSSYAAHHEQIRRPAHSLYPSSTLSHTNLVEETYQPSSKPGATLLFNGIPLPPDQLQEFMRQGGVVQRSRNCVKFRTPAQPPDHPEAPLVSSSTSTPHLTSGEVRQSGSRDSINQESSLQLRNEMDRMAIELRGKESEILQVRNELSALRETLEKSSHEAQTSKTQCVTLRLELTRLERQIESLEDRFDSQDELSNLKDFLTSHLALSIQGGGGTKQSISKSPDYDRLINMIRELNSIAGNYQSMELCYTLGGATFKTPDALVLTLYKNGFTIDDTGVFRPFDAPPTAQFIQDIYDGYFPTELQSKYPEGITLVVKDKRGVIHPGDSAFPGKGKSLNDRPQFLPKFYPGMKFQKQNEVHHSVSSESNSSKTSVSSATSFERLPDLLPTPKSLSQTQTQRALYKNSSRKFLTLKLKNLKTESVYKLKTTITSTPDDILLHLESHLGSTGPTGEESTRKYELINSIPFGSFTLGGATLREYGITSNSLIYFRPI